MKVLMINGSPHAKGNTYLALHEMEKVFAEEEIETEILHIGNKDIRAVSPVIPVQRTKHVFLMTLLMRRLRSLRSVTALL